MIDVAATMQQDAQRELPDGWRWVRLGDVAEINPRRISLPERAPNAPTTFIPMTAIDERQGKIAQLEVKPYVEVRKGYTAFIEGDVLFAKITPCMQNGKHAVAQGLIDGIGFGSTEFHVLRPGPLVTADWIHHFVRQPWVLHEAMAYFTGSVGQQRVPDDFLRLLEIPLPPLAEQQRITAILTAQMIAVEQARVTTEAQLAAAKDLPVAYLRAVFESDEAHRWQRVKLSTVCQVTKLAGFEYTEHVKYVPSGEYIALRAQNIRATGLDLRNVVYISKETAAKLHRSKLSKGNVVMTFIGANIGDAASIDKDDTFYCGPNIAKITPDPTIMDYNFLVRLIYSPFIRHQIEHVNESTAQPSLSMQNIRDFDIIVPPLTEQKRIATLFNEQMLGVQLIRKALEAQLTTINQLPAALLRRAFAGEL